MPSQFSNTLEWKNATSSVAISPREGRTRIHILANGWSERGPDGDWVWHEDRIQHLLSSDDGDVLFLSGCATNQVKFYSQFDHIILLSAPAAVIVDRLRTRTNNPYGKGCHELYLVLDHLQTVEPLLRKKAGHEIDTSAPVDNVVESVLRIVRPTATRHHENK